MTDEELAEVLAELPELKVLDLSSSNKLTDKSLKLISEIKTLEALGLPNNDRFTTASMQCLSQLNLERYRDPKLIGGPNINIDPDRFGIYLRAHKDVSSLHRDEWGNQGCWDLSYLTTTKGDAWIKQFAGLSGVRRLEINGVDGVTDEGLKLLQEIPDLEWLILRLNSGITKKGIIAISKCKKLLRLELLAPARNQGDPIATLALLRKNIDVDCLKSFAGERLLLLSLPRFLRTEQTFGPYLDALSPQGREVALVFEQPGPNVDLDLGTSKNTWPATPGALRALRGRTGIKSVHLHESLVASAAIGELWTLPDLQAVTIDGAVSDDAFSGFAKSPKIRRVVIGQAENLTDQGCRALAASPTLDKLRLRGSTRVTDKGVEAFQACSQLKELSISKLGRDVGAVTEARLKNSLPACQIQISKD